MNRFLKLLMISTLSLCSLTQMHAETFNILPWGDDNFIETAGITYTVSQPRDDEKFKQTFTKPTFMEKNKQHAGAVDNFLKTLWNFAQTPAAKTVNARQLFQLDEQHSDKTHKFSAAVYQRVLEAFICSRDNSTYNWSNNTKEDRFAKRLFDKTQKAALAKIDISNVQTSIDDIITKEATFAAWIKKDDAEMVIALTKDKSAPQKSETMEEKTTPKDVASDIISKWRTGTLKPTNRIMTTLHSGKDGARNEPESTREINVEPTVTTTAVQIHNPKIRSLISQSEVMSQENQIWITDSAVKAFMSNGNTRLVQGLTEIWNNRGNNNGVGKKRIKNGWEIRLDKNTIDKALELAEELSKSQTQSENKSDQSVLAIEPKQNVEVNRESSETTGKIDDNKTPKPEEEKNGQDNKKWKTDSDQESIENNNEIKAAVAKILNDKQFNKKNDWTGTDIKITQPTKKRTYKNSKGEEKKAEYRIEANSEFVGFLTNNNGHLEIEEGLRLKD